MKTMQTYTDLLDNDDRDLLGWLIAPIQLDSTNPIVTTRYANMVDAICDAHADHDLEERTYDLWSEKHQEYLRVRCAYVRPGSVAANVAAQWAW